MIGRVGPARGCRPLLPDDEGASGADGIGAGGADGIGAGGADGIGAGGPYWTRRIVFASDQCFSSW